MVVGRLNEENIKTDNPVVGEGRELSFPWRDGYNCGALSPLSLTIPFHSSDNDAPLTGLALRHEQFMYY